METERLRLCPATRRQMEAAIAAEADGELRQAYSEMLACCLAHPEQWDWYAMWRIEDRDGELVGDLCFKGLDPEGRAEIGYGILAERRGRGYATEAVRAALDWAFGHPELRAVEAETEPGNAASQRVLLKCGFLPNGVMGQEGPRWSLPRQRFEALRRKEAAPE